MVIFRRKIFLVKIVFKILVGNICFIDFKFVGVNKIWLVNDFVFFLNIGKFGKIMFGVYGII